MYLAEIDNPAPRAVDYSKDRVQNQPELTEVERLVIELNRRVVEESRRRIEAIDWMMEQIRLAPHGELKLKLIEEKYWKHERTDYGIALLLNISIRTLYNWDNEIIRLVGLKLGYDT